MGEPVLGSVSAGARPFRSAPSADPPRTSVAVAGFEEVSVAPMIVLPDRVDDVLPACSVDVEELDVAVVEDEPPSDPVV